MRGTGDQESVLDKD